MVEFATLINVYLGIPVYAVYKLTPTQVNNFKTIQRPSNNPRLDTAGWLLSPWPRVNWVASTVAFPRSWPVKRFQKPEWQGLLKGRGNNLQLKNDHWKWKGRQNFTQGYKAFFIFIIFFIAISYITLHTKITYYFQCQRNLQFNDNNKTYNANIIYDFNNLHYNNILHYNWLISFM